MYRLCLNTEKNPKAYHIYNNFEHITRYLILVRASVRQYNANMIMTENVMPHPIPLQYNNWCAISQTYCHCETMGLDRIRRPATARISPTIEETEPRPVGVIDSQLSRSHEHVHAAAIISIAADTGASGAVSPRAPAAVYTCASESECTPPAHRPSREQQNQCQSRTASLALIIPR